MTHEQHDPNYNPNRTEDLFALTGDGYIIAQDIACQTAYVAEQPCPACGERETLRLVAQINHSFQGLNELVTVCTHCGKKTSFIFDISNDVYQQWWATIMGDAYIRPLMGRHGPPPGSSRPPSARGYGRAGSNLW